MIDKASQRFAERLKAFSTDEDLIARIRVDLSDLLESFTWFSEMMKRVNFEMLTPDELEILLAELETKFIWHSKFHLKSLSRDIQTVVDAIPDD